MPDDDPSGMTVGKDGCPLKNCEDDRMRIFLHGGRSSLHLMSLGSFSFGCLVRMKVERFSSSSISFLLSVFSVQ